jgi:hypothetical protein
MDIILNVWVLYIQSYWQGKINVVKSFKWKRRIEELRKISPTLNTFIIITNINLKIDIGKIKRHTKNFC